MKIDNLCEYENCGCESMSFKWKIGDYIWLEVPKCASKSIKESFPNRARLEEVLDLNNINWDKYFVFAFVRNPWSRTVSNYFHFCTKKHNSKGGVKKRKAAKEMFDVNPLLLTFEEFVDKIQDVNNHHWLPCHYYLPEDISKVDFIGRMENFEEDAAYLENNFELHFVAHKYNKTRHKHYSHYYNEDTKEIVSNMYKKDIELFNFQFEE